MNTPYRWRYEMTPKEARMAREMGVRRYYIPTLKDRFMAWFIQWLP